MKVPEGARPVTDRVKKTVFDIIGKNIQGLNVLDLFAGSGSFGIEALSQGANNVTMVDNSWDAINVIKENTKNIDDSKIRIIKDDYYDFLRKLKGIRFDLIFLDPPFPDFNKVNYDLIADTLTPQGLIVIKAPVNIEKKIEKRLEVIDKREIGNNIIYFLSKANPQKE